MWEPVSLPFKSDSPSLPALPTTEEIRACTNVLWEPRAYKVVAVNDEIVVKFGTSINVWEGQALIYLERYVPEVAAPRLYAMYHDSRELFLVMQRAPGVQLNSIWPSLKESEKDDIVAKLRRTFDAMRHAECPWPGEFFGGLDGGPVHHYLFYTQNDEQRFLGPYNGESAFAAGLAWNFRAYIERNKRPDYKARFYETYLGRALQGHYRPTLTHSDVQQKNIMVSENPGCRNIQGERSFDIMLVDWENAGWYPEYWEYFSASCSIAFHYCEEDWTWRVTQFLQVWPAEMAMMRMVDRDLGMGW